MNVQQEFENLRTWPEHQICTYLATKVRAARREYKESQASLAKRAGVPLRTYKRFETHGRANLETFVQVLRAIGRTEYLFMLFSPPARIPPRPSVEERLKRLSTRTTRRDEDAPPSTHIR